MNKKTFLGVCLALSAAAGTTLGASAQVSSALLGSTTTSTTTGGVTTSSNGGVLSSGLSALRTGGAAITTYTDPTDPTKGISSQTTGSASGGKVGTFTFSGSEGQSQNFSVGTSTNFGINASASSTSEYQVTSNASMGIGTSNFKQVIGTSGIQESESARSSAKSAYVENTVSKVVGNSSSEMFSKAAEESKTSTTAQMTEKYSWWTAGMSNKNATEIETAATTATNKTSTALFNDTKIATQQSASSEFSSSSASSEAANGVISGSFKAASTGLKDSAATTDNNEVTVKGIGNSANLNASSNSQFTSNVTARTGTPTSNSATANGSAGASMSSTSTANASNTAFSSVFIQSF